MSVTSPSIPCFLSCANDGATLLEIKRRAIAKGNKGKIMMSSAARNACPCDYRHCSILLTINVMYKEKLYHIGKNKRAGSAVYKNHSGT